MNWISILGLCLITLGTIFSFFGTYLSDKKSQKELTDQIREKDYIIDEINANNIKLIDQNSSLLTSNEKVSGTNENLISQNSQMLERISKYQADIEERNLKIIELEREMANFREYSYYADYNIYGTNINAGEGIKLTSDLYGRMSKILVEKDGQVFVKSSKEIIPQIDEVIKRYPNFPFGYFAKFDILKVHNDPEWKVYAAKAIKIFEVTTTISGHDASHDQALSILRKSGI
ncbi:hypothetical protein BA6E_124371 [Bacteroidales bacterium 6E]|nr:hypothetical protein BA6E_124371 [Bacteroidales bacterium 6E]